MFFAIAQLVLTILLAGAILLQPGESGFGGSGLLAGGEFYHTRRGVEKITFYSTFVLTGLFVVLALAAVTWA